MSKRPVPLAPDEIIPAIRDRRVRKLELEGLRTAQYYADRFGHIYSLNNPAEPKLIEEKEGNGLMWVALYQGDGRISRFMVGDLVAETFLIEEKRLEGEDTVRYKDGNPSNNCVENLAWATRQEQSKQLRLLSQLGAEAAVVNGQYGTGVLNGTAPDVLPAIAQGEPNGDIEVEIPLMPRVDEARKQRFATEDALEAAEARIAALENALAPFAAFHLSPSQNTGLSQTVVLESNRGTDRHSLLLVHDFRTAYLTYQAPRKKHDG